MAIDFTLTPELEEIRLRIRTFVDEVIKPVEATIEGSDGTNDGTGLQGRERIEALIGLLQSLVLDPLLCGQHLVVDEGPDPAPDLLEFWRQTEVDAHGFPRFLVRET